MRHDTKLVNYPAHGDDFFLCTSEKGLEILKKICHKYGKGGLANCWIFGGSFENREEGVKQVKATPEYAEWLEENRLTWLDVKEAWDSFVKDPWVELPDYFNLTNAITAVDHEADSYNNDYFSNGAFEVSDRSLASWECAACVAIFEFELGIPCRHIAYGSEDHHYWLSFVED